MSSSQKQNTIAEETSSSVAPLNYSKDRIELYEDGLKVTSKFIHKYGMGSGATAIVMGHILKLYKSELGKLPKMELAVETHTQKFDRLVQEKTGLAKATTSRYSQLASLFLVDKEALKKQIEDNVSGLDINEKSLDSIMKAIGERLEVTTLYRKYGILPEIEDKRIRNGSKTVKELFLEDLDALIMEFGEKAIHEGYDVSVIVSIQDDLTDCKLKAEKSLEAEQIKARVAKETRARVVTKKTKREVEANRAMKLNAAEMKEENETAS